MCNFRLFCLQLGSGVKGPAPGPVGGEKGPLTAPVTSGRAVQPRRVNNAVQFTFYITEFHV